MCQSVVENCQPCAKACRNESRGLPGAFAQVATLHGRWSGKHSVICNRQIRVEVPQYLSLDYIVANHHVCRAAGQDGVVADTIVDIDVFQPTCLLYVYS